MAKKGFRRVRRGVRRPRKSTKASFAKRVFSVINKQRELKVGNPLSTNITDVRGNIESATRTTNIVGLFPSMGQGDGEGNREGNLITLKKIVIRGYFKMNLPTGSANASRILLRAMILKQRDTNDGVSLVNGLTTLQYGTLIEPANTYLGSVGDFNTPVNKDQFIVKKDWKRAVSTDYTPATASNAEGLAESYVFFNHTMTFGKGK